MTPTAGTISPRVSGFPFTDDYVLHRVSIVHDTGELSFNDNILTREQRQNIILLGLIRQRVFWGNKTGSLICKSYDFQYGYPDHEAFPWELTSFSKSEEIENLECSLCTLKHWNSDGKTAPLCVEQYVVPILIPNATTPKVDKFSIYTLGVMNFQKSSMRPIKNLFAACVKAKKPAYASTYKIAMQVNLARDFKYSVPSFKVSGTVEPRAYPLMSEILRYSKDKLTTPQSPVKAKTGGLLSVSTEAEVPVRYSGSFFS